MSRAIAPLLAGLVAGCEGGEQGDACSRKAECQGDLLCVDGGCLPVANTDTGSVYVDPVTSLEWQHTPTGGNMDWESAVAHCQTLNLDGAGWRLPSIDELRSLLRGCPATATGGACGTTDTCLSRDTCMTPACAGCEPGAGPAAGCYWPEELGGSCEPFYWSSSNLEEDPDGAWYVLYDMGHVCFRSKAFFYGPARCVR
jgi:hypothetical protein